MSSDNFDQALYDRRENVWSSTSIPGLVVVDLKVDEDARGWSKTPFPSDATTRFGLPIGYQPTRWCANANQFAGVTRGIHAELANKFVSLARGKIFAAIVDLRAGATFANVETVTLDPGRALLIPRGCGNGYQTQTDEVYYSYLADDALDPLRPVTKVNVADPNLAIKWPIPLSEALILAEDQGLPGIDGIRPIDTRRFPESGTGGILL